MPIRFMRLRGKCPAKAQTKTDKGVNGGVDDLACAGGAVVPNPATALDVAVLADVGIADFVEHKDVPALGCVVGAQAADDENPVLA